jgi:ABC-2 type transport system ATP-binding protein
MSVQISDLTKIYGDKKALNNVSFEAKKGMVTGFLGPNGAGKTTTMKILSCFIQANSGSAAVCGFDTQSHPEEVKRRIGYLPEHNPLYKDMYVKEYLRFVAGMQRLGKNKSAKIGEMIELTGLGEEQHKKIGSLSKGYRQRVGLAQALIHDPEVLILDEPTSGLDPNQLADIRQLIINLGKEKTVILSTHIMQEVEAVCDNVIIINQGSIVANGSLQDLKEKAGSSGVQITVGFNGHIDLRKHFRMDAVQSIKKGERAYEWIVTTTPDVDLRPDLFRFAVEKELVLLELSRNTYEVEDVFRLLTK